MSWGVVLFTTFGGLRGAVSLILAQILVLDQEQKVLSNRRITAEVRNAESSWHHFSRHRSALENCRGTSRKHDRRIRLFHPIILRTALYVSDKFSCTMQIALWTSGFVVLTLIINAPLMPWLLKITGAHSSAHRSHTSLAPCSHRLDIFTTITRGNTADCCHASPVLLPRCWSTLLI